jgi:hypothetical protein
MVMSTLTSPRETLDDRIDRLVPARSDRWPPLHSTPTHAAIGEIIERVVGLEAAVHELALEVQTLRSAAGTGEGRTADG